MSQEQIHRFGEPYFSTKTKGTGLGTMVAVKIIETIWKFKNPKYR